jgi:hypothetical protein
MTWRDTKSAIILFSKRKNFSNVLESIKEEMERHAHKKRGPEIEGETRFRYILGNPNDHKREIVVTVLAFSVVSPTE